ncbi:MAG: hypothetical protein LUG50_11795 [Planctomycetaceae bacterium]|nr:hypothetical protein [Planctomycetaceae bacterium]
MSTRTPCIVLAGLLLVTTCGCFGGGKEPDSAANAPRGRTGGRSRFLGMRGRKKAAPAQNAPVQNIDQYSPDSSMERDLRCLRESEMAQRKRVEELRGGLDQRSDLIRREEERLAEIQQRIDDYNSALDRYDSAMSRRPESEYPRESNLLPRNSYEDTRAMASGEYGRDSRSVPTTAFRDNRDGMNSRDSRYTTDGEERVIYDPRTDTGVYSSSAGSQPAGQYADNGGYGDTRQYSDAGQDTPPRNIPLGSVVTGQPARRGAEMMSGNQYDSPGPGMQVVSSASPSTARRPSRRDEWVPDDHLFSKSTAQPPAPDYPGLNQTSRQAVRKEDGWPENVPPVMLTPTARKAQPSVETPVDPSAFVPMSRQRGSSNPAIGQPEQGGTDEVDAFMPDLFLSGR